MSNIIKITSKEQFDQIIAREKNVFVDFNAQWCGPCKMLAPFVHQLAEETQGVTFLDVDVDSNSDLALEYQIMSIPALMMFKDGKIANKHTGFMAKNQLTEFVK
ncbi:thioredoxin [Mesoplasma seiffertii]|uniref:thioredoxin n=1 Tax=Mesoplasma seiffertii TaxID=28224 RepID=UPI00047D6E02|nr:thioredoxin [Mesoplasma seiffertii]